ncbi:L-dopachrome tautomerase yellow-f-like [Lutzomyia longipalpis]|uniref:L-dopachrome tautomerase yellow-f-like n=1 Tax=Lutzomyia longipalpis TaxID=7200 RepID=UPI002483F557|nr:L-dopachrome tautomerase yellow-f-like [Lutzomyia longipalpis]
MNLILFLIVVCFSTGYSIEYVEELYKWKIIQYENPPQSENSSIGPYPYYVPEFNSIVQMGYHPQSGLMIVTVPRMRPGVPITLGAFCVQGNPVGSSPKIWGFPNYEVNTLEASDYQSSPSARKWWMNETSYERRYNAYYRPLWQNFNQYTKPNLRIISTYTVNIDEKCNRAFTLDWGYLVFPEIGTFMIQKPAILVFDVPLDGCKTRNFKLIRRIELPDFIINDGTIGFMYMTLDQQQSSNCDDLFIYMGDMFAHILAVYDYKKDEFWAFRNQPSFLPEKAESNLVDDDFKFYLEMGIVHLALSYPDKYGDSLAYYLSCSSAAFYSVPTKVLKDKKNVYRKHIGDEFQWVGYRGCHSQTSAMAVDYTYGVVFFAEPNSSRIRCWNMRKPFKQDNMGVVYQSPTPMYVMIVFVDSQGYLWFNKTRIGLIFMSGLPLNIHKVHSAFYRVKVSEAIKGTICENNYFPRNYWLH